MDWIVNKEVTFQDQNGYRFIIDVDRLEFGSMESYVYKNMGSLEPYHSGQCWDCIQPTSSEEFDELIINNLIFGEAWRDSIIVLNNDYAYFKIHPCNFCKYKGNVDCILIFDIAFARKCEIKIAIEVENTSPVKWNKLKFCKENDITLIEVKAKDINNVTLRENKIIYGYVLHRGDSMGTNGLKYI